MEYSKENITSRESFLASKEFFSSGFFPIDYFVARWVGKENKNLFFLGLLLSKRLREGFIFIDKYYWQKEKKELEEIFDYSLPADFLFLEKEQVKAGQEKLVLENGVVYFKKYWKYEQQVFNLVKKNAEVPVRIEKEIENSSLFPDLDKQQIKAINTALYYPLSIISGGPGTGKTTIIGKILNALKSEAGNGESKKVALVSFTGKAVHRIKEQLGNKTKKELIANSYFYKGIFLQISTLHSMLNNKNSYIYNKKEKNFDWDFLIVDETSMISLSLMARVLEKTAKKTKVVLIGDYRQIHPIEAGYFFFDLSLAVKKIFPPYFVLLSKNYRYEKEGNIASLVEKLFSKADAEPDVEAKKDFLGEDIIFFEDEKDYYNEIFKEGKQHWENLSKVEEAEDAFKIYYQFVILCSLNVSNFGVEKINEKIQQELLKKKQFYRSNFYNGKPLLIEINTPRLRIYNGDIGICLKKDDKIRVYFQRGKNEFFSLALSELPKHKSGYAISIHKAQGSEFEKVLICLPSASKTRKDFIKRELLYTAITRAKKRARILCQNLILNEALKISYQATTNLIEKIGSGD